MGSQQWCLSLSCVRRYYADSSATENNHCSFPVSHYHGITITISVPKLESLCESLSLVFIDLEQIEYKLPWKNRLYHAAGILYLTM